MRKKSSIKLHFKKDARAKRSLFALRPILPQLFIVLASIGVYYAMVHFYFFFQWGFYLYYVLKLAVAFAIMSSAFRSLLLPLASLLFSLAVLFTNCFFLHTLMDRDTAWELGAIALIGILIAVFSKMRSSNRK